MGKLSLLLVLVAAAGIGYLTRPTQEAMRDAADAVLSDPNSITEGLQGLGATIAGNRVYFDYYVVSRYQVSLDNHPIADCWGGYTQIKCTRQEPQS